MKAMIITNNPEVKRKYNKEYSIKFVNGELLDVLITVRDKVHNGYKLLTHPLAGSVKPNETPYKSVLVSYNKGDLDLDSLVIISSSIETTQKFINIRKPIKWEEKILRDFREIDLDLINSGIESMRQ